jgi:hypothetical protein
MTGLPLQPTDDQIRDWVAANTTGSTPLFDLVRAAHAAGAEAAMGIMQAEMAHVLAQQTQLGQLSALRPLRAGVHQLRGAGRRPARFVLQDEVLDLIDTLIAGAEELVPDDMLDKINGGS